MQILANHPLLCIIVLRVMWVPSNNGDLGEREAGQWAMASHLSDCVEYPTPSQLLLHAHRPPNQALFDVQQVILVV